VNNFDLAKLNNLFSENKRMQKEKVEFVDTSARNPKERNGLMYISSLNAMKNPDILMGSSAFLKGNLFFKDQVSEKKDEEGKSPVKKVIEEKILGEDEMEEQDGNDAY
jgi:hypothetical protein